MAFLTSQSAPKVQCSFYQLNVLSYDDKKKAMGLIVWLWASDLVKPTVIFGFNPGPHLIYG
jgi:hypothetical protein